MSSDDSTGLENMRQLIQLRWIAVVGQVVTIALVHFGFDIHLPLREMSVVLTCLVAFNIASMLRWRAHHEVTNGELFFALLVDVATLTGQLYLSGGATNPFSFLYLLQVILGAVLLRAWSVWTMVGITTACFIGLTFIFRPLALPRDYYGMLFGPYIEGTLICFAMIASLLVIFITRINRNLRARDARLADLRERAAEEEHIIRMGLLASGAAHELGTPLSTVCVILGDWRRMSSIAPIPKCWKKLTRWRRRLSAAKILSAAFSCPPEKPAVNRRSQPPSELFSMTWWKSGVKRAPSPALPTTTDSARICRSFPIPPSSR